MQTSDKMQFAKMVWLLYYNDYLYRHNIITAVEKSKMTTAIHAYFRNN